MTKKLPIATTAALSLTATPVLAAAPTAAKLSLAGPTRVAKAMGKSEKLEGRGAIIAAVLAAGVVVGGIIAIANDDDPDSN